MWSMTRHNDLLFHDCCQQFWLLTIWLVHSASFLCVCVCCFLSGPPQWLNCDFMNVVRISAYSRSSWFIQLHLKKKLSSTVIVMSYHIFTTYTSKDKRHHTFTTYTSKDKRHHTFTTYTSSWQLVKRSLISMSEVCVVSRSIFPKLLFLFSPLKSMEWQCHFVAFSAEASSRLNFYPPSELK